MFYLRHDELGWKLPCRIAISIQVGLFDVITHYDGAQLSRVVFHSRLFNHFSRCTDKNFPNLYDDIYLYWRFL